MRIAILAHDRFPDAAKTAIGVMRYGDQDVVAVLDRSNAGTATGEHTGLVPDVPIVEGMDAIDDIDALLIGVAPIGGGFEESWRPDVRAALERGIDVVAGLHAFLGDDPEFSALANESGADIRDVRQPPPDLTVSEGEAGDVPATVVLTVGTDASVGKMTASFELVEALNAQGHDAVVVPTGQTGIMIEGWGYPIDRVIADFMAGAVEDMILEVGWDHDVLVVEGQGSLIHPAYSGVTCGILHGAMPDGLVLCHDAARDRIHSYEQVAIPPLDAVAELYERVATPIAPAPVVAGAIKTSSIDDDAEAMAEVEAMETALGVPTNDVVRFGAESLVEPIV